MAILAIFCGFKGLFPAGFEEHFIIIIRLEFE